MGDTVLDERGFERPAPFTCVICEKAENACFPGPRQIWSIAPVCSYCERTWGRRNQNLDGAGSFKDRRIAIQIEAMAERITAQSYQNEHKAKGWF
jgi:hypothetical protein